MALYAFELTLPPSSAAQRRTITVGDAVVTRGFIRFPRGCAGLVGVRFLDRELQFAPLPAPQYMIGDGLIFEWAENRKLQGAPFQVTMEAYNQDDTYPHTIRGHLEIMDLRYSNGRGVY